MKFTKFLTHNIFFVFLACNFSSLLGQSLRIDITGVGQTQIPIALAPFETNSKDEQNFGQIINDVIQSDLRRTASFNILPLPPLNPALNTNVDISDVFFDKWRNLGTHALLIGDISLDKSKENITIRFRLLDTLRSIDLGGLSLETKDKKNEARTIAHRISDFILESLTDEPGFFSTRLAYVIRKKNRHLLIVSDSDGHNERPALESSQSLISLAWSPKGDQLAYVSFETGKPTVFTHTLSTGKRNIIANYKGSNSSPTWSPNGRKLAFVLTKDGSSQIYSADKNGKNLKRITKVRAINTEPNYSHDGQYLYYTSDQGGSPQIYRINSSGNGYPKRITFNRKFNARPVAGPNGNYLAYVTSIEGDFVIAIMNLNSKEEMILSGGPKDDSPSFAPNGRWLIFSSRISGKEILSAVSVDGKVKTRITMESGNIRSPAWGKLP
ncbi:MAG: Tol-Pal system beta propeller repeat protein TolB [Rickettsiales bacterium]|nr:Tol-Pal system beta propeller repeat protein TolB [Rickettsiales bacterium]OUW03788.1 MAG: Tol-Pal system beta propeller repeat protein TolB [Betaproteobacteria bacterium TMED156]